MASPHLTDEVTQVWRCYSWALAEPELVSQGHPSSSPVGRGDKKCTQLPLLGKHVLSKGRAAASSTWGAGRSLPVIVGLCQVEMGWGGNSEHKGWGSRLGNGENTEKGPKGQGKELRLWSGLLGSQEGFEAERRLMITTDSPEPAPGWRPCCSFLTPLPSLLAPSP